MDEINPAFQLGGGYALLIASRLAAEKPGRGFRFFNRGTSGNAVQDLAARWQQDALDLRPDLLSILVGVNNANRRSQGRPDISDEEFFACYRSLLDQVRGQNPGLRLMILEPFLLEVGDVTADSKSILAPMQNGIAEIAAEFGAIFLPLQSIFDHALDRAPAAFWAYDGIHATHAGFQLIADAWLKAAKEKNYV